jgi:hypothetical protein
MDNRIGCNGGYNPRRLTRQDAKANATTSSGWQEVYMYFRINVNPEKKPNYKIRQLL